MSATSSVAQQRILQLDFVRGVAVLGIFLLNVIALGLPMAMTENPTAMGPISTLDTWLWALQHIFAQQKFIALFGMLFGAGILLFAGRAQQRGLPDRRLHMRRMGWLALFGLLHAWLFWYGDVLFSYAIAGMLAWLWRQQSVASLLSWGIGLYLIPALFLLLFHFMLPYLGPDELLAYTSHWAPEPQALQDEIAALQGGFMERIHYRASLLISLQTDSLIFGSLWLVLGYMLIGMALFKSSIITLQMSSAKASKLLLWLIPGLALSAYGVFYQLEQEFSVYVSAGGVLWNYVGSLMTAVSYIGLLALIYQRLQASALARRLEAVGRMAFSAYIMQTLIGVILFQYIGLFGELQRYQLILLVIAVWAVQLIVLPWYLQRFTQGPLERLWRRLTYWRAAPNQ